MIRTKFTNRIRRLVRTRFPRSPGIYVITSSVNGKRYVGSTVDLKERKRSHLNLLEREDHYNIHLQNHVNKYGLSVLKFSILEFCIAKHLIKKEQYWYDLLQPEFNLCSVMGSRLGMNHTKETKRKLSKLMKGKGVGSKHIEETRQKMSKTALNSSEETLRKRREGMKGIEKTKEHRKKLSKAMKGENSFWYGKKHTKETKQKMKEAQKGEKHPMYGKHISEDHKQKISKALKGKSTWNKGIRLSND